MTARLFRLFWLAVLVGHTILAILWWWLQAGGFPAGHPRFWSNTVAPIAALAFSIGSLWALHRESTMGRPAGFAFLDRDGSFRVVEATSGEKGPFRTLASGRLGREEPLSITLLDRGRPEGTIALADWARQADTSLSPTAGWGAPANAIEFSLSGNAPSAPASIFVTLASTSIGRGWDCVGHTAGTYRNRILFEKVKPD
jgi:hypothetical protein